MTMDDTKLFVDIDDEITFVCERIFNAPSNRVILVVPERSTITSSLISLKILRKQVLKHDQRIVIVTLDEIGSRLAKQAGFISRSRVGEVNEDTWEEVERIRQQEEESETHALLMQPPQDYSPQTDTLSEQESSETPAPMEAQPPQESLGVPDRAIPEVEVHADALLETPTYERPFQGEESPSRFVPSAKKVNLQGFDMVVGGDIAVERAADTIESKDVRKTREVVRGFAKSDSLINKDISGFKSKQPLKEKEEAAPPMPHIFSTMKIPLSKKGGSKVKKIGIALLCLFLLIGTLYTYFLAPASAVTIYTKTSSVDVTKNITATPNVANVNLSSGQIPAQYFEVTETATDSAPTTGSTTIGNKATGNVTIVNQTTQAYTLPAGTVFTTKDANGYTYVLSADVTVPAGTQDGPNAVSPANAAAILQASDIGDQYNLPATPVTTFAIKDQVYPLLSAYNTSAFTGGSSKTVQAVAQADMDALQKKLETELYQKGQADLQNKIGSGEIAVSSSFQNKDVQKSFDNQLNAEASILNLTLTTKTSGLGFKQSDLTQFAKEELASSAKGLTITKAVGNVSGTPSIASSGDIALQIHVTGTYGPKLNLTDINAHIKGKSIAYAQSYITGIKGVKSVDVQLTPRWVPGFLRHMPFQSSNITITVKGQ